MKIFIKNSIVLLAILFAFGLVWLVKAVTTVSLGTADSFAILAGSTITNTGNSVIGGDLGLSPGTLVTGFPPGTVSGTQHVIDAAAGQAQTDLTTAYNNAAGQTPVSTVSTELGGTTKTAGIYDSADGTFGITGTLTLNAQGDPSAVFIFKTASTLITAANSNVTLINGAQACHVFWQVGSSATLGSNSTFRGNILALASVTLTTGASVDGRVLARNGAVTLDTNNVTKATCLISTSATLTITKTVVNTGGGTKAVADFPLFIDGIGVTSGVASTTTIGAHTISETHNSNYTSHISGDCATNGMITLADGAVKACTITNTYIPPAPTSATIHVIKHVINYNGGSATAANFTIHVTGTNVSNLSFAGSEAGVDITLDAGSYSVTEPVVPTGYLESGSGSCSGTIAAGETKICTITNDDVAPRLVVNKIVVNDNGGTKVIADFPLFIDGIVVTSGVASTTTIGVHTISETPNSNYTSLIGGDCATDGTITLALGDVKTCTITNDDIEPPASDDGSSYSYVSPVPPLIDVVKVPSPLVLPDGPGPVTYTYTLRNIGTVPVTNITMVGDTCSPIVHVSGDTNGDNRLDVAETWVYTCVATLAKTHTNIVTTIGWAGGIIATDIANATVIVGIPVVPPLIHVTKIPSSLTLPSGGAMIVYTNKVTNPGTVSLSNVRLTDDKCDPVKYISGDINNDSKLDTTETWTYTCQTKLIKTTVNTVTASGEANGLTTKDFAIATVIVVPTVASSVIVVPTVASSVIVVPTVPKLPTTGVISEDNNIFENFVLFFGLLMLVSMFFYLDFRLKKLFQKIVYLAVQGVGDSFNR